MECSGIEGAGGDHGSAVTRGLVNNTFYAMKARIAMPTRAMSMCLVFMVGPVWWWRAYLRADCLGAEGLGAEGFAACQEPLARRLLSLAGAFFGCCWAAT